MRAVLLLCLAACSDDVATQDGGTRDGGTGRDAGAIDGGSSPSDGGTRDAPPSSCREVSNGDAVAIGGSGFGEHADYNDVSAEWLGSDFLAFRFKDMEDGALDSMGFYPQRGGSRWDPSAEELAIVGDAGERHLRRAFDGVEAGGLSADVTGAGNRVYATFAFRLEQETQAGKFFRLYADSPQNNFYLSTGCSDALVRGYSECDPFGPCTPETEWGTGPALTAGEWQRVEVWADADASLLRVSVSSRVVWQKDDWLHATLGANGHTVDFPNMIDEPGAVRCEDHPDWSGAYAYDDLFVDFTQARVELAEDRAWIDDAPREIQIPSAWSEASVTFLARRGSFELGRDYFVHVVRADGAVVETGECVRFR